MREEKKGWVGRGGSGKEGEGREERMGGEG